MRIKAEREAVLSKRKEPDHCQCPSSRWEKTSGCGDDTDKYQGYTLHIRRRIWWAGADYWKKEQSKAIGFNPDIKSVSDSHALSSGDLVQFGLIPELIGRLPVIVSLDKLDEKALKDIITKPRNSILKQYQSLFAMEGVSLSVTEDALHYITHKALSSGTGARGIRGIMEEILEEPMFLIPDNPKIRSCTVCLNPIDKRAVCRLEYIRANTG